MSFTRFFISGNHSGQGEIDIARAHVPANAAQLNSSDFHTTLVWPEEPNAENEGAYVAVAPGGDTYVAWERNVDTNLFFGDPHIYEHVALVPAARERAAQRREEQPGRDHEGPDQRDAGRRCQVSRRHGDRGLQPRHRERLPSHRLEPCQRPRHRGMERRQPASARRHLVAVVLPSLGNPSAIAQVNDDSDFALHFLPALSVRSNGHICTSWYDRRRFGPDSAHTDYFGECRPSIGSNGADFRITTGATDWTNTSSLIIPQLRRLHRQRQRRHDDVLHLVGRPYRRAATVRGQPLTRHAVVDGLDVVAVGVLDVRGVVAGVVLRP